MKFRCYCWWLTLSSDIIDGNDLCTLVDTEKPVHQARNPNKTKQRTEIERWTTVTVSNSGEKT